jgi:ABC-type branched-subunit amino acid transport system substrate-binding protein
MLFIVVFSIGCTSSDRDRPIEIGHIHPPGPGEAEFRGLKLAIEDMNRDPASLPLNRPLSLRSAPGGDTPDAWHGQATRLIAVNRVAGLIGGARWSQAERIGQAASSEKAIAIGPAGWSGGSLFAVGLSPTERGRVLAQIAREVKPERVLIVREKEARAANAAADRFAAECQSFARVSDNVSADAIQVEGAVLFLACSARKLADLTGYGFASLVLFGDEDAEVAELLKSDHAIEGLHFAMACDPDGKNVSHTFAARYQEAYRQRPNADAILAFDCLSIWVQAARRANSIEPEAIRQELLKREQPFDSATGPLTFADDRTARRKVHVYKFENGELQLVSIHDAEPVR